MSGPCGVELLDEGASPVQVMLVLEKSLACRRVLLSSLGSTVPGLRPAGGEIRVLWPTKPDMSNTTRVEVVIRRVEI